MSARNMAKRTAAGTLALAVCLSGGAIALAGAANADANFKFDTRIAGAERYDTAIEASKAAFPEAGKTENVVLVNGFATVDGLTASYLAGVANAPILYVSDKGADAATKAEIKRLGAKNVWLVGGTTVIPTSVETAIKGDGYTVTRINGSDRYETAKLIAEAGAKIDGKKPAKVFVASGTSFADALAVSPIAFAKHYAIVLTEKDSTSDYSKKALGDIGTSTKILVGGEAVVSESVAKDLTVSQRVSGADRAVTANLVSDWAKSTEGFKKDSAILVGGTNGNGADSLVAASFGGKNLTTLHFAGWEATETYLKDHAAELTGKGYVFGGPAAVTGDQVNKAQAAAQTVATVGSIKVTPTEGVQLVLPAGADDATDDRSYSATGLNNDLTYRVTLVNAASIKTVNGQVQFLSSTDGSSSTGYSVDPGSRTSVVSVLNGSAVSTALQSVTAKPVGGTLTFTVDGVNSEKVVPVIYVNGAAGKSVTEGGTSERLETSAKSGALWAAPVESYGLGGQIDYIPTEQASGAFEYVDEDGANNAANTTDDFSAEAASAVTRVEAGYIVANDKVLKFDKSDKFYVNKDAEAGNIAAFKTADAAEQVTYDEFVKQLSKGDQLLGTSYQREASLDSVFLINDIDPAATATPTLATRTDTSVTLTVPSGVNTEASKVTVYGVSPSGAVALTSKVFATGTKDGDADAAGYQVEVTGLTAASTYSFAVTQTVGTEESALSGTVNLAAAVADVTGATVSSVGANDVNNGTGSTNEVIVTFNEKLSALDASKITIQSGAFTYKATAVTATNTAGTTWKVTLDGTLADAITAEEATYFLNLTAGAATDVAGNKSLVLTGDADTDGVLDAGEKGFKY